MKNIEEELFLIQYLDAGSGSKQISIENVFLAVRQPKSSTGLGALKVQWLILVFQIGKSGWWAMGVMMPVQIWQQVG